MNIRDLDLIQMESNYYLSERYDNLIKKRVLGRYEDLGNITSAKYRVPLLNCKSYFDIVNIIGELKNFFSKRRLQIFFRGQRNSYNYIQVPAFIREFAGDKFLPDIDLEKFGFWNNSLDDYIYSFSETLLGRFFRGRDFNLMALEPTLAHYGIKSRWIDLVDSIPLAIWFSLFDFKKLRYTKDNNGYIFIYGVNTHEKLTTGIWEGPIQRLVKLNEAFPPLALRPHSQHAILMTDSRLLSIKYSSLTKQKLVQWSNFNKFLLCVLTYEKNNALQWLIKDTENPPEHLSFETLFPSPEFDTLYDSLLNDPFHTPMPVFKYLSNKKEFRQKVNEAWEILGKINGYNYAEMRYELE